MNTGPLRAAFLARPVSWLNSRLERVVIVIVVTPPRINVDTLLQFSAESDYCCLKWLISIQISYPCQTRSTAILRPVAFKMACNVEKRGLPPDESAR